MRVLVACAAAALVAAPAFANDDDPTPEAVTAIEAKLAEMSCQMDPDDIEVEDDGTYDLDDVICEGGNQFDIVLDADFNEVSRRAE